MPSKTFEEILNNASAEDKAAFDKTKALATDGKEATSIDAPTSVPNKTADATPVTGRNVDHLDSQVTGGNSATMSEISDKPATTETPTPTPEPEKEH